MLPSYIVGFHRCVRCSPTDVILEVSTTPFSTGVNPTYFVGMQTVLDCNSAEYLEDQGLASTHRLSWRQLKPSPVANLSCVPGLMCLSACNFRPTAHSLHVRTCTAAPLCFACHSGPVLSLRALTFQQVAAVATLLLG